jgi:hypothetical protein
VAAAIFAKLYFKLVVIGFVKNVDFVAYCCSLA